MQTLEQRMKWWRDARFGMFIHWGLYSACGVDCWMQHDMGMPPDEYAARFEPKFTAKRFDPDAWFAMAKAAGFRYVIMTARHHEGYCLWDTATTDFSAAKMTPHRDLVHEYLAAARRAKMRVGLYYSLLDWRYRGYWLGPKRDPKGWAKQVELVHAQVRELMSDYGKIDVLWYDGAWADTSGKWGFKPTEAQLAKHWQSRRLNSMVRRLQPHILLNNRAMLPEDFGTPEQDMDWIAASQHGPSERAWELCDTFGDLWGHSPTDRNRKTAREALHRLISSVAHDGNYLLNIGPRPDGSIAPWQCKRLEQIGAWMKRHANSVHGCVGEWQRPFTTGLAPWRVTRKGNKLYLHMLRYPGTRHVAIARLHDYHITRARLLDTNTPLKIEREPTRDILHGLPAKSPDPLIPVIELTTRPATAKQLRQRDVIGRD